MIKEDKLDVYGIVVSMKEFIYVEKNFEERLRVLQNEVLPSDKHLILPAKLDF